MQPIKIGMIGYGGIGRVHAMAYRDIGFHYGLPAESIQIAGVATSRKETAHKAAVEIGCDFYTDDYRDLLKRNDIDIIDCCTPNNSHEEILIAAAQAGKHIYCEKPLAMDVESGKRIVEAVEKAGVKSQMTFNFRFFPALMRARQLIEQGFLGRVFQFRGRYYRSSYISASRPYSWRMSKEQSGGGALLDLGSHLIDIVYYLLGEVESVQAYLETLIPERPMTAGSTEMVQVDVDDLALLHLRLANGAPGSLEVSRMGTGATNDLQIEISGDKGALRFRADDPTWLEVYDVRDAESPLGGMRGFRKLEVVQRYDGAKAPDWSMTPGFVRTHAECQYQFIKAIIEDKKPAPTLADGLHVQAVMEAAQRAAQEGRWVKISSVR
ncbi:MAG: Gfo/Idh/MocA family oxidoreductase [Anaerolineae bacterium]